jgi:hypothetical protein
MKARLEMHFKCMTPGTSWVVINKTGFRNGFRTRCGYCRGEEKVNNERDVSELLLHYRNILHEFSFLHQKSLKRYWGIFLSNLTTFHNLKIKPSFIFGLSHHHWESLYSTKVFTSTESLIICSRNHFVHRVVSVTLSAFCPFTLFG